MKQPTAQDFIDIADNYWNDTEIGMWYTKKVRKLNPKLFDVSYEVYEK